MDINGISIIGSGNVGRRIGEYFSREYNTIFYDVDENVIKELNKLGHLSTTDINFALNYSNISFIAVPTPITSNGSYDTSFLEDVSQQIGIFLRHIDQYHDYHIFVIKSTIIPGTIENIIIPIIEKFSEKLVDIDFGVICNPEFLTVIHDTWTKDKIFCISPSNEGRIILGESYNKKAGDIIKNFYEKINPNIPILRTNYKTAEFTKLIANNRLALAISFSNEIFSICEKLKDKRIDIDVDFVIDSISRDPRIGKYGSVFGKAWGGPCFLKDTAALDKYIKDNTNSISRLIAASLEINDDMKKRYGIRDK